MTGESNPIQVRVADHNVKDSVTVTPGDQECAAPDMPATSNAADSDAAVRRAPSTNHSSSNIEIAASGITEPGALSGKRWWLLAALSALLLTVLTAAGVYLVTKKPSTVDQLVILTVPSGAQIKLDSKDYGHSPVKLEHLVIGTYTVTISKDGFDPIVQQITVAESGPVEFKLKPALPSETINLPAEDQIKRFQQQAEDSFARGYYGSIYEGSALNYADIILSLDPNSGFASEMRERVRNAAHQSAQSAISRGDFAQALETYNFLLENYPNDEEARAAIAKLETQLSARRGDVREIVRKADEALQAGRLTDPFRTSAYYYSKQALAIDHQNDKARQIRNQVREKLAAAGEQTYARGDVEAAIKQLEQVAQLFPEDKQVRTRVRELQGGRIPEASKPVDSNTRRLRGLEQYGSEHFAEAIPDLERAVADGQGTPAVVFALARSYMKSNHLDQAEHYFRQIQPAAGSDAYPSSLAALGDIANQRGDSATAVKLWKEARQLGGSALYPVPALDDRLERIERKQREKAAEPSPLTLPVKHLHGLLGGSCTGRLTIDSTGVRYDGEHVYTSSLVGAGTGIVKKDEMVITFQGNSQRFKVARAEAERFREMLARYQQYYSPSNK
jgi:tetratricopeptide (TPR) repeat protein